MDPEIQKLIEDLTRKFSGLEDLFLNHRHRGISIDQTNAAFPYTYHGTVSSAAAKGTPFPLLWTVASGGTGIYNFTHNLGHTNYIVVALPQAKVYAQLSSKTATGFVIKTFNDSGTATASALDFILISTL